MTAPSVFLSYARSDLAPVQRLEQELIKNHIVVWRDQDKIYGGQKWPRILGEAIASQNFFLLAWSKNAADSYYVELEWCTAAALKKTIVPCLLDDTPLPATLKSVQIVDAKECDNAIPQILHALHEEPAIDPVRYSEVISKLGDITATKPGEVIQAVKDIFSQHHWIVQEDVLQAGRDINITNVAQQAEKAEKTWLEKWGLAAALLVSILTALTLIPQVRKEWASFIWPSDEQIFEQALGGFIKDEKSNKLLPDVQVTLPEFGDKGKPTTNADGYFVLRVPARKQATVQLIAKKDGYVNYSDKVVLGDSKMEFSMQRISP